MVKNLSNPLNARKVASILQEDFSQKGMAVDERKIAIFLSDNQISNIDHAFNLLKSKDLIPKDIFLSIEAYEQLIANDFISPEDVNLKNELTGSKIGTNKGLYKELEDLNLTHEEELQLESFKNNVIKSWSGGLSIGSLSIDKFDTLFSKPMQEFINLMKSKGVQISELQAYTVIFSADHLSLREASRLEVYDLIFGKYDSIKDKLNEQIGLNYSWPNVVGSGFMEIGKKYSTAAELSDFAQKLKNTSGIDTYSDKIIQSFFRDLLLGKLTSTLLSKRALYRWSDSGDFTEDPFDWIIPPAESISSDKKSILIQTAITHTILNQLQKENIDFIEILKAIIDKPLNTRVLFLSKLIETRLILHSIELQFGGTLSNYIENFRENPGKNTPFLNTVIRYLSKSGSIVSIARQTRHSIISGLKNSKGAIKKYLPSLNDDELKVSIEDIILYSLISSYSSIEQVVELVNWNEIGNLDKKILDFDSEHQMIFFSQFFDSIFEKTKVFTKNLEPENQEPTNKEGGLSELTQNFLGTIDLNARKNPKISEIINKMESEQISHEISDLIAKVTSYVTYQIIGREGSKGEILHNQLIEFFKSKVFKIKNTKLISEKSLIELNSSGFYQFILKELTQLYVISSIMSKLRVDVYNTWTPLDNNFSKATQLYNEFLLPNLIYWQRLPRSIIQGLEQNYHLDKQVQRLIVEMTGRFSLVDPYLIMILSYNPSINSLDQAQDYLYELFQLPKTKELADLMKLSHVYGEAQIVKESLFIWYSLQELNHIKSINKIEINEFLPIELAITLPKGFAYEYQNRNWFDHIYFGKLSMSEEQQGYQPVLYMFDLEHKSNFDIKLPESIMMTFYKPEGRYTTQINGIIVIGGKPDLYKAFYTTKLLTPYLEGLILDKYPYINNFQKVVMDEILTKLALPVDIKPILSIIEKSIGKEKEMVSDFFPILKTDQYSKDTLILPNDFQVDAVYSLTIQDNFFTSEEIGTGIKILSLYTRKATLSDFNGKLIYPLVFRWQPVYNDILKQLKTKTNVLPENYDGILIPKVIIFHQVNEKRYVALISSISKVDDNLILSIAVARSNYPADGLPLSIIISSLNREKFGEQQWYDRLNDPSHYQEESDLIHEKLLNKIKDVPLVDENGNFDLGKVMSLKN